jgi:hypothetical protein
MGETVDPFGGLPDDRSWSEDMHRAALDRHDALRPCAACGTCDWGIGAQLLLLPALDAQGRWAAGRGVDVVPVFCRNCGLLRLHASTLLLR